LISTPNLHTTDNCGNFERELRTRFPTIKDVFTTASTTTLNEGGHYIGRYNLLCSVDNFVPLAKELHEHLSPLYIKHVTEVQKLQELSQDMEPVEVITKFPGKPGIYSGSSVGSGSSLTTQDSYLTHCDIAFDEFVFELEADIEEPPPVRFTPTATTTSTTFYLCQCSDRKPLAAIHSTLAPTGSASTSSLNGKAYETHE
jgi:hypothetical protein